MSNILCDILLVIIALFLCPVLSDHINDTDICEDPDETSCHCGVPAEPEWTDIFYGLNNTRFEFDKSEHSTHKSRIVYKCHNKNDLLVGNEVRRCHRGKWLGDIPRCAINLANETRLKSIDVINWMGKPNSKITLSTKFYNTFGAFTPPKDFKPGACPPLPTDGNYIWHLSLDNPVPINYIQFKFYGYNIRKYWAKNNFRIRVYMVNSRNITSWINCSVNDNPIGNISKKSYRNNNNYKNVSNVNYINLEYFCEDDRVNVTFDTINMEFEFLDTNKMFTKLRLCDLRVYRFEQSCGEPDFPVTLQVLHSPVEEGRYDFFCVNNDYVLEGKNYIKCGVNGKWLDDMPICVPSSFCRAFHNNTFGNNTKIEYEKDSEWATDADGHGTLFQNGTTARLTCKNYANGAAKRYTRVICEKGRWVYHESQGLKDCNTADEMLNTNQRLIRIMAMVLIGILLIIFLLIFNMIKCCRRKPDQALTDCSQCEPNDYDLAFYESEIKYEEISETYDRVPQIYYNYSDELTSTQMHMNPIFRDDASDVVPNEFNKTNSIYSNLSNL